MKARILVIDDEVDMLRLLKRSLENELNCEIETASSGEEALKYLEEKVFDLALIDIRMPGMDGIELLEQIKRLDSWLTIVMMTAYGTIDIAVESIKKGAYDFIRKPFEHDDLIHILKKALERSQLIRENLTLRGRIKEGEAFQDLIGNSAKMQRVYDLIQIVSKNDVNVLITGESGTGKSMAAKAIHALSSRANKPFVRVNCPTIPESILESELFGYRKGAFTHAVQNKRGLFEEANGGTIFLDEIGEIGPSIQVKLLQVLEEKEFKPLGDTKSIKIDVKVIASTNSNLVEKMKKREFREDLYYRLSVIDIKMPPLRERTEDIPLLVEFFIKKYCSEFGLQKKQISPELMRNFLTQDWPGNVRELENVIKKAVILAPGNIIELSDVEISEVSGRKFTLINKNTNNALPYVEARKQVLEQFNISYITSVLKKSGGNVSQAARISGLKRQALQQIMKKYHINPTEFKKVQ